MLERIPPARNTRRVFRLASIAEDEQFNDELGLDREALSELLEFLADAGDAQALDELLDGPFRPRRKRFASRFSDGSFPVLYTSLEPETAEAEITHWFPSRIGDPRKPRVVYFSLFSCTFDGTEIDLRPMVADWTDLVHESDYSFCNRLGAEARRLDLDGLATWSVRRKAGTNVPVFARRAVSRPNPERRVALTFDPSSGSVSVRHLDD